MQVKHFTLLLGIICLGFNTGSVFAQNDKLPILGTPAHPAPAAVPTQIGTPGLAFDSKSKEYSPKTGEAMAPFVFNLTNITSHEIVITNATTSCGCTVAKLPSTPWHLAAGANGQINATVNLAGKSGTVVKGITVNSSEGIVSLSVMVHMPVPTVAPQGMTEAERKRNNDLAAQNRQTVFQLSTCAECHVKKGEGKIGQQLYAADCGICHDSPHRAASVPNLHSLPHPTDLAYWKDWIANSQPGKLMPAFAQKNGGPLTDIQIDSIASYLNMTITRTPAAIVPLVPTQLK